MQRPFDLWKSCLYPFQQFASFGSDFLVPERPKILKWLFRNGWNDTPGTLLGTDQVD
jgi:hypothetical protein